MGTIGTILLLFVGFLVIRFLMRAKSMSETANTALTTGQKINMVREMARKRCDALVEPGAMTADKQFYIGYLGGAAEEQARADNQPLTMFRGLVAQEAADITGMPEDGSSLALYEACIASEAGTAGKRVGTIDGGKLADRQSSQPYFVELDAWLASKEGASDTATV